MGTDDDDAGGEGLILDSIMNFDQFFGWVFFFAGARARFIVCLFVCFHC